VIPDRPGAATWAAVCAVVPTEDAADRRTQKIENHQGRQRPGRQAMPAASRLLRLASEPARGVAAGKRGDNAGEGEPDAGTNGEGRRGRISVQTRGGFEACGPQADAEHVEYELGHERHNDAGEHRAP
jgi:hypothetical protein